MSTRLPQINFVFDRYKKASLTVKAAVEIRVSYNYKQKYISTGVMLYANQWKNGHIVNVKDAVVISQSLEALLTKVRQILFDMIQENNIDIFAISDKLKEMQGKQMSFLGYCKQRAVIKKYGKAKDSQKRYDRFIKLFTRWGKIKKFEDIKESNIVEYDSHLSSLGMKPYSKWNNYHRFLHSFIVDAIDEGYISKDPYKWLNIDKKSSYNGITKYLTPEEFKKIKKVNTSDKKLERIKDVFIFQTYTCLSYVDLKNFDSYKIQEINGMKVYVGIRQKTGTSFTIPLLPIAVNILNKYNGILPVPSNQKYNDYLKLLASSAKINKPLSSHWARHTGATLLLNEGVEMKIISRICGHSSTKMTEQVYAKLLDETIVDAMSNIKI